MTHETWQVLHSNGKFLSTSALLQCLTVFLCLSRVLGVSSMYILHSSQ